MIPTPTKTGISWDDLIPFTGRHTEPRQGWTHEPWLSHDKAWATDGRIIISAKVDKVPDLVLASMNLDRHAERHQQLAVRLFQNTLEAFDGQRFLRVPPCGIPPTQFTLAACPACGHHEVTPRPEPIAVAVNGGFAFFDAYYLNLLHALPVELDFVIEHPARAAMFCDRAGTVKGILMPMRLSAEKAKKVTEEQWGSES